MARETFADEFDGPDLDRHPMQMMIAVFDFPEMTTGDDDDLVPELVVEHVRRHDDQG
jgi:hypothetical protein